MDISKAINLLKNVNCSDYTQLKSMPTEQLDELENAVKTLKNQRQQKEPPETTETPVNNHPEELESKINKNFMTELKSFTSPPEAVKTTLSAFMLVLGHTVTDAKKWQTIQILMGNPDTMMKCKNIQIKNISTKQAKLAEEILNDNGSLERVKSVSLAAAQIHKWTSEVVGKVLQGK